MTTKRERERERERERDRQTDRKRETETERERDRNRDRDRPSLGQGYIGQKADSRHTHTKSVPAYFQPGFLSHARAPEREIIVERKVLSSRNDRDRKSENMARVSLARA